MFNFPHPPPLGLYVHIPWCVRKCPYCDFNSHAQPEELPESAYVTALIQDFEQETYRIEGRTIETIFIGGGTPSLFQPGSIEKLLEGISAQAAVCANAEITLEANPGAVEHGRFQELRSAGVNRLSIGIQSFNDQRLQQLGRVHDSTEAVAAVQSARDAGFDNFNLDLMFGLPDQTPAAAAEDLTRAIALEPTHISHYQLTIEPNTLFHAKPPVLPDDDAVFDMQERCCELLAAAGYAQYEVSAFARPRQRSRHNLNYWRYGDYLGIGAGAHGKMTNSLAHGITRTWKQRQPAAYMKAAAGSNAAGGSRQVTPEDAAFEFMLNSLRLNEGFTVTDFEAGTGLPLRIAGPGLDLALERGLLEHEGDRFCPSVLGRRFLNNLTELFLPKLSDNGTIV